MMRGKIMAYVSQKDKKELAVEIKKVLKKYGMKAQHISCTKSRTIFVNKIKHACVKYDRISKVHEMELVDS